MTTRVPDQHRPENAATLAAMLAFVLAGAFVPDALRPILAQLFLGYTPQYLATLAGLVAGGAAARLTYRRVRARD